MAYISTGKQPNTIFCKTPYFAARQFYCQSVDCIPCGSDMSAVVPYFRDGSL